MKLHIHKTVGDAKVDIALEDEDAGAVVFVLEALGYATWPNSDDEAEEPVKH